jgi:hypothetical protein
MKKEEKRREQKSVVIIGLLACRPVLVASTPAKAAFVVGGENGYR